MRIEDFMNENEISELRKKTLSSYVSKKLARNPNVASRNASSKDRSNIDLAMDKLIPDSAIRKPKVPASEAANAAQQAAIAINIKKRGIKPKKHNENVEVIPEADKTDVVSVDVPLLLRMMEYAREDAKTDMDLHDVAERMIKLSKHHDYLCMDNYEEIVGVSEDDMEESNAFTNARMNAIKAGKKSFAVGGKTYPVTGDTSDELEAANEDVNESCPHCGGLMVHESQLNEKKDACYYKVKSRYKVWPSAYASGALVKCRKAGAKNWGNKSK